ncbi:MAG: DUF4230 domain-containing protein [Chloroflexi bacterium]|jgi:hypothetical protein|nr:DUF4230 domain-containing protein [Chloroflexota bacterium]
MDTDGKKLWVLIIGILVIFAAAAFGLVWVIRQTIRETVSPVQETTGIISTRVAQILMPTPTVFADPVTIVRQVNALSRLETIQYVVEKVITAETGQEGLGFLFGDRLIFVAHGTVIAGVDLAKMQPEDIRYENGVLFVEMPQPEIFVVNLDNDLSYVYDRNTGLLTRGDVNLETTARRAAEDAIEEAALDGEVLRQAQENAHAYLERLFRGLGFEEVVFTDELLPVMPTRTPAP